MQYKPELNSADTTQRSKMAEINDILYRSQYKNFLKCHIAQDFAKTVLGDIVATEIDVLQKQIFHEVQSLKSLPPNTVYNLCMMPNLLPCPKRKICIVQNNACSFHIEANLQPRRCPTNGFCDAIRDSIIDQHRFCGPSWKNTDSSQWCTDSWTIAKCFMPPDGYAHANTAEDTDFNGILNVIINCTRFQSKFSENLRSPTHVCKKVRRKCRRLRHSPTLNISDDKMNTFIDTLADMLNDPLFFRKHQVSIEYREKLEKLKTDSLDLSAADANKALESFCLILQNLVDRIRENPCVESRNSLLNLKGRVENVITMSMNLKSEIDKALYIQNSSAEEDRDVNYSADDRGLNFFQTGYVRNSDISVKGMSSISDLFVGSMKYIRSILDCAVMFIVSLAYPRTEFKKAPKVERKDAEKIVEIQKWIEAIELELLEIIEQTSPTMI